MMDTKARKQFITCNYNRDGNSYRSPHSSQYFPPTDSKFQPSHALRLFEVNIFLQLIQSFSLAMLC